MASAQFQQHLTRLDVPGPVQLYAIAAIFDTALKSIADASTAALSPGAENAVLRCLCLSDPQAVGLAVERLGQLVKSGHLEYKSAHALLLTALSVASQASAPSLATGYVSIFFESIVQMPSSSQAATAGNGEKWISHPLTRALLADPSGNAGPTIIAETCRRLAVVCKNALGSATDIDCHVTFAVRPFLTYVLLDRRLAINHPLLPPALLSGLVRIASSANDNALPQCDPKVQLSLLNLVMAPMAALRVRSPDQQLAAADYVANIVDMLYATDILYRNSTEKSDSSEYKTVATAAHGILALATDVAAVGGSTRPFVAALDILSRACPVVLVHSIVDLARLGTQCCPGAESAAILSVLSRTVQWIVSEGSDGHHEALDKQQFEWNAALAMAKLVPFIALGQDAEAKKWAVHVLNGLQQGHINGENRPQSSYCAPRGNCVVERPDLWVDAGLAVRWTEWVVAADVAYTQHNSHIICALLYHGDPRVVSAAIEALCATPKKQRTEDSILAISALPILIHALRRHVDACMQARPTSPSFHRSQAMLLPILGAIPRLVEHAHGAVPFIVRALAPLLDHGAPASLQAIALRLLCDMWRSAGGRGFPHLRNAILSYGPTGPFQGDEQVNLPLRLAWAATLADVAEISGDKAAELVHPLTACLQASEPGVQAAGLKAVASLCESDTLDFYKAWKVVRKTVPTLPTEPSVAVEYLRLMSCGFLDAAGYSEVAGGIVDALWAAAKHPAPQVRRAACMGLAGFDPETLDSIDGALRPLHRYAELLRTEFPAESDPTAVVKENVSTCEALISRILRYEYSIRRRLVTQQTKAPGSSSHAVGGAGLDVAQQWARHRLTSSLPRTLLLAGPYTSIEGGSSQFEGFLQRLPDISPAAVLYLWSPHVPQSPAAKRSKTVAARATEEYSRVFQGLCTSIEQLHIVYSSDPSATDPISCIRAWTQYMRRWVAAARDAAPRESEQQWENVLGSVLPALRDVAHPVTAVNATWAAAGLLSLGPKQPPNSLVATFHDALIHRIRFDSDECDGVSIRTAACIAIGAIIGVVRTALGSAAVSRIVDLLIAVAMCSESEALEVRCSAILGLGPACRWLHTTSPSGEDAAKALDALTSVLLGNRNDQSLSKPLQSQALRNELVGVAATALAEALPAIVNHSNHARSLILDLRAASITLAHRSSNTSECVGIRGACALLQATTLVGYQRSVISTDMVAEAIDLLTSLASDRSKAVMRSGKVVGVAAATLGSLLPLLVKEGFKDFSSTDWAHDLVSVTFPEIIDLAVSLRSAAAAKTGVAAGIAALVGARILMLGPSAKRAVQILEDMALRDSDPHVRYSSCWSLATLCWTARRVTASSGEDTAEDFGLKRWQEGPPTTLKSLESLSPHSALRYLSQAAISGVWPSIDPGDEPSEGGISTETTQSVPLHADGAAAVLRCLTASPRLPALDWTAACRRLIRAFPGSEDLQVACVELAARHGESTRVYLSDFIGSDILGRPGLLSLTVKAWAAACRSLPGLLAALPDDDAIVALSTVCAACPVITSDNTKQTTWAQQAALLEGLALVISSSSSSDARKPSSAIATTARARQAFKLTFDTVLPKLAPPNALGPWILITAGSSSPPALSKNTEEACVWRALLRCIRATEYDDICALCIDPVRGAQLPVHWAWIAAALNLHVAQRFDSHVLQLPRNAILRTAKSSPSSFLASFDKLDELDHKQQSMILITGLALAAPLSGSEGEVYRGDLDHRIGWIIDVLGSIEVCDDPWGAVALGAVGLSATALALAAAQGTCEWRGVPMASCAAAIQGLPFNLKVVFEAMEAPQWELLRRIVKAMRALEDSTAKDICKQCCMAVRHSVADDAMWLEICESVI